MRRLSRVALGRPRRPARKHRHHGEKRRTRMTPSEQTRRWQALDARHHLHPVHDPPRARRQGCPHHHPRRGLLRLGQRGQPDLRRHGGAVVHPGRPWPRAAGAHRLRADQDARLLQRLLPDRHAAGDRAGGEARHAAARGHGPDPLRQLRLRGQRHRRQVGLVLLEPDGRPQKKQLISRTLGYHGVGLGSASLTGMPFMHGMFDLPLPRFHHIGNPYPWAEGWGKDPAAFGLEAAGWLEAKILELGARERGRVRRRADPGCGRRDHPARDLLARGAADLPRARRAAGRRRGDLRLRPHRQLVGPPDHGLRRRTWCRWPRGCPRATCRSRRWRSARGSAR